LLHPEGRLLPFGFFHHNCSVSAAFNDCLRTTTQTIHSLIDEGTVTSVDAKAATRLINGAALNAALWIAASDGPRAVFAKAVTAFRQLVIGLLKSEA
jgi:hypothetical protein